MNLIFDSGAVSALATDAARLTVLRQRGWWPPTVPAPVLAECLTGDHRRDFQANRLLRSCRVESIGELTARAAATLRTATGRADRISATDAIVAAWAIQVGAAAVVTSDPDDLTDLLDSAPMPIAVVRV